MSIRTRNLVLVLIFLSSVIIVLQLLILRSQMTIIPNVTPTPIPSPPTPTSIPTKVSWKQEGIPIVRGEFAHYQTSDDCVYVVIDQPIKTKKILKEFVSDYSSKWSENFPLYPIQFRVSDHESITLAAMNAEEISNTFAMVNGSVYKITANVGVPQGPPRCLGNYDQAISELLGDLNLTIDTSFTSSQVVYLKSAYTKSGKNYITSNILNWIEDPNAPDGYVVENNNQIRTFSVSPQVKIALLDWTDSGMVKPSISFNELTRVVSGTSANYNLGPNQPFDITIDKNNVVTAITLRYTP